MRRASVRSLVACAVLACIAAAACATSSASDAVGGTSTPSPVDAKTVVAAGDIVCDPSGYAYSGENPERCQHRETAALVSDADAVLLLGDLQYPDGSLERFETAYDPTWGQYADISYPAIGNHEYNDPAGGAMGYFEYWTARGRPVGDSRGAFYSFDLGSWHLIALNSECAAVPCDEGTPQNDFLEADLASSSQPCILAYWHHPLFNSGLVHGHSEPFGARAFWEDLFAARADIVLNGHEHNYQRYDKQDPLGVAVSDGIRQFVVGSGGSRLYGMLDERDANFEFGNAMDFGVLRLDLAADSYSWEFVTSTGAVADAGGPVPCN